MSKRTAAREKGLTYVGRP